MAKKLCSLVARIWSWPLQWFSVDVLWCFSCCVRSACLACSREALLLVPLLERIRSYSLQTQVFICLLLCWCWNRIKCLTMPGTYLSSCPSVGKATEAEGWYPETESPRCPCTAGTHMRTVCNRILMGKIASWTWARLHYLMCSGIDAWRFKCASVLCSHTWPGKSSYTWHKSMKEFLHTYVFCTRKFSWEQLRSGQSKTLLKACLQSFASKNVIEC